MKTIKIYVNKLISLNPDKYKQKDFYKMLNDYSWYCVNCGKNNIIGFKTFEEWLKTEI